MFQTPTTQVWKRMFDQGKLNAEQSHFWKTKPPEELYDLRQDRDEVKNLANSREHSDILKKILMPTWPISVELSMWAFLPEGEIHSRSEGTNPYEMARTKKYPYERIFWLLT